MDSVAEKVTIKNVTPDWYNGEDTFTNTEMRVKPGEQVVVSVNKAKQLLKDFPNNWSLIKAKQNTESELSAIHDAAVDRNKQVSRLAVNKQQPKTVVAPTVVEQLVASIKENKTTIEKVSADALAILKIVAFGNFVGVVLYEKEVPILKGEFGSDTKRKIRYVLVDKAGDAITLREDKKDSPKKEDKKENKSSSDLETKITAYEEQDDDEDDEADDEEEGDELPPVNTNRGRDIDPEEDLGVDSAIDELEGEDADEKQTGRKRRIARRRRGDDEDDD